MSVSLFCQETTLCTKVFNEWHPAVQELFSRDNQRGIQDNNFKPVCKAWNAIHNEKLQAWEYNRYKREIIHGFANLASIHSLSPQARHILHTFFMMGSRANAITYSSSYAQEVCAKELFINKLPLIYGFRDYCKKNMFHDTAVDTLCSYLYGCKINDPFFEEKFTKKKNRHLQMKVYIYSICWGIQKDGVYLSPQSSAKVAQVVLAYLGGNTHFAHYDQLFDKAKEEHRWQKVTDLFPPHKFLRSFCMNEEHVRFFCRVMYSCLKPSPINYYPEHSDYVSEINFYLAHKLSFFPDKKISPYNIRAYAEEIINTVEKKKLRGNFLVDRV